MDGVILFIVLFFLALLILLVAILVKSSSMQETLDSIKNKMNQLKDQLYDLEKQVKEAKTESKPRAFQPEPPKQTPAKPASPPVVVAEEKPVVPPTKPESPRTEETARPEPASKPSVITIQEQPIPVEAFFEEKKTDWEKFIGENLTNKIGIAVLVLGISFFVKFAIDKNWINETGRVIIGLISGGILIGLAHSIRDRYRSFSSVLVGGGLTVFYFTIAFAFHQYHLIGQQAAFVIMVMITGLAVALSLFYDRIELAILATIGGFITPFLVSTGENNYIALFTYLCILNCGLLVLSWFKRWKPINIIALFFTVIIYGSWLFTETIDSPKSFPYQWALLFGSLFFALSVTINIINNVKLKIQFGGFDFILLLTINFLYYIAGMVILQYWDDGDYKGLFTASLGIVNLVLALIFFTRKGVDRNLTLLLIGLTLTFISLAGPVQFRGNHITLFWAAEAVVLFWLFQRSRINLLKIASLLILLPMLINLCVDWSRVYGVITIIPIILNKGFITTLISAAALLVYYQMMRKETDTNYLPGLHNRDVLNGLLIAGICLGYAAGAWEVYYQFLTRLPLTGIYVPYLQLYTFLFVIFILRLFKKLPSFIVLKFGLTIASFALYLYHLRNNYELSLGLLTTGRYTPHFIAHWLSAALLIGLLYDLIRYFRQQQDAVKDYAVVFTWIASACLVFLLSVEMYHVIMWTNYRDQSDWAYWENLYYKAGLSILWGLCSFTMMWLGMKNKFRVLRVVSLTLFTITLVKLFIYDIQKIPPGGKIAAFILLGILLLTVSFMYQRLKRIIVDDGIKTGQNE